jgi:sugar phosphate isomerase/epimerase
MQRVLSTYFYRNQKLTPALLAEIEREHIPYVEIFCAASHFDYRSEEAVREIADWLGEHELAVHSLHSPTSRDFAPSRESGVPISISDLERVRRLDAVDEVKRALDVAERIPFRYLVQHLGASRESADPRRYDAAFNSLEHLAVFAKQRGVTIALENTPGELGAPTNLRHFIEDTRLHDLRLCFDTGHAHMEDGIEQSYEAMRDLVVTTHIHDNHGEKDEHLLPYEGTIDWNAALKMMGTARAAPGGLPFTLELKEPIGQPHSLQQIAAIYEKFENARAART